MCGLVGAIMVGPRFGRFVNGRAVKIEGHNKTLVLLGGLVLWFGWVSVHFHTPSIDTKISHSTDSTVDQRLHSARACRPSPVFPAPTPPLLQHVVP